LRYAISLKRRGPLHFGEREIREAEPVGVAVHAAMLHE
jgi:hypothetical protein